MRLIFRFVATVFRWVFYLVLLSVVVLVALYFPAKSALRKLDDAAALAVTEGAAPPVDLSRLQRLGLFVTSQLLPLHQPGGATVVAGKVFRDCPDLCPEMVAIPAGYYLMGSPLIEGDRYVHVVSRRPWRKQLPFINREGPRRLVRIPAPLAFSSHEITFAEWDAAQADPDWEAASGQPPRALTYQADNRETLPATGFMWYDAQAYARWLSARTGQTYRLATDAEWEYAARAGTVTARPWGMEIGSDMAACAGCGPASDGLSIGPVGRFPPNGFGLYDMIGNGWEWVEDCFAPWHDPVKTDGSAHLFEECEFVTFRGGSFEDPPWQNRSAMRVGPHPDNDAPGSVIRLVREM
ncbi:SUMF1/EgtB/PvdO family nonheme iron enzyme [Meridianimarinicoccus sp. MJW13]|uniref:formylglycine-generating enzyme family protein n=1 Tax=Meridianimarinicoccus sp. MJW13 TaxID=2720031 RepID=UPI0018669B8B|nr:SUMF1/EgtB/PvdO family nonheme iron enzyme [Fluviibacterium sp. MJW13]